MIVFPSHGGLSHLVPGGFGVTVSSFLSGSFDHIAPPPRMGPLGGVINLKQIFTRAAFLRTLRPSISALCIDHSGLDDAGRISARESFGRSLNSLKQVSVETNHDNGPFWCVFNCRYREAAELYHSAAGCGGAFLVVLPLMIHGSCCLYDVLKMPSPATQSACRHSWHWRWPIFFVYGMGASFEIALISSPIHGYDSLLFSAVSSARPV